MNSYSVGSKFIEDIGPNEIISPIATLIGLLVVAVGFLHSSQFPGAEIGNLTNIILSITFVFILTVLVVVGYVLTGSRSLWSLSIRLYLASWAVFGMGIIVIFTLLGYGNITYVSIRGFPINLIFITQLAAIMICMMAFVSYGFSPEYTLLFYIRKRQGPAMNRLRLRSEIEQLLEIKKGSGEVALLETCEKVEALVAKIVESDMGSQEGDDYYKSLIQNILNSKQIVKIGGHLTQNALEALVRLHVSAGSKSINNYQAEIGIRAGLLLLKELGQEMEKSSASNSSGKNPHS